MHGFYFGALSSRRPELEGSLTALREELDSAASSQDASDLKVWALQELGLQAAARVLSAAEPLRSLRDTCQDFPFVARALSKTRVPRELASEVERLQTTVWSPRFQGAFLNGRALPLVEENDLAGLLTKITREMRTVDALATVCSATYIYIYIHIYIYKSIYLSIYIYISGLTLKKTSSPGDFPRHPTTPGPDNKKTVTKHAKHSIRRLPAFISLQWHISKYSTACTCTHSLHVYF